MVAKFTDTETTLFEHTVSEEGGNSPAYLNHFWATGTDRLTDRQSFPPKCARLNKANKQRQCSYTHARIHLHREQPFALPLNRPATTC